jgi:hypothetical protein
MSPSCAHANAPAIVANGLLADAAEHVGSALALADTYQVVCVAASAVSA